MNSITKPVISLCDHNKEVNSSSGTKTSNTNMSNSGAMFGWDSGEPLVPVNVHAVLTGNRYDFVDVSKIRPPVG